MRKNRWKDKNGQWKDKYHELMSPNTARFYVKTGGADKVVEALKTFTPRQQTKLLSIVGFTDDLVRAGYEPFDRRMRGIHGAGMKMSDAKERQECASCKVLRGHTIDLLNLCNALDGLILRLAKKYPQLPIKELAKTDYQLAKRMPRMLTKKKMAQIGSHGQ